jgi:3'-phosphoadenosine 5'-phosphosulfate sulfotransferase (PAPS reductase)/FAD synthetase
MSSATTVSNDPQAFAGRVAEQVAERDCGVVVALCSGGHDSTAMLLRMADAGVVDVVAHCNTGTGIPQTREYVMKRAADAAVPYIEGLPPEGDRFADIVFDAGFPGDNKFAHQPVRERLKGRVRDKIVSGFDGEVVFLTGVRRHESDARWNERSASGIELSDRDGREYVWVNPCTAYLGTDVNDELDCHDCPRNEVRDVLGSSGECLCASFGSLWGLKGILEFSVERALSIVTLMGMLSRWYEEQDQQPFPKQYLVWGHGGLKDRVLRQLVGGELDDPADFPPFACPHCDAEFDDRRDREAHVVQEHDDDQATLSMCHSCGPGGGDGRA